MLSHDPGGACDGHDADDCIEGIWQCNGLNDLVCSDASTDDAEQCNGLDDDCDGVVDEGANGCGGVCALPSLGQACDGPDSDACADGAFVCSGLNTVVCDDADVDSVEVCNAVDDDCDGVIDDGDPGGGKNCGTGCAAGVTKCINGQVVCEQTGNPGVEECNGLDDDCDGQIDEGVPSGAPCSTGKPGVCAAGTTKCNIGVVTCQQTAQPSPESCNGLDDNCNGVGDEGVCG